MLIKRGDLWWNSPCYSTTAAAVKVGIMGIYRRYFLYITIITTIRFARSSRNGIYLIHIRFAVLVSFLNIISHSLALPIHYLT